MLNDAVTAGFDVRCDDGRLLRVLPGRLRLDARHQTKLDGLSFDVVVLKPYLSAIDPGQGAAEEPSPIPFDEIQEVRLHVGDRVEVLAEVEHMPDPEASEGGYRAAPTSALSTRGVPRIKVLLRD